MHRFKITQFDVDHVIKHIQKHDKITKNDIVPGWAQIEPDKFKIVGSKLMHGEKQIIPVENVEKLLRDMMFDKKSDIPLSRDSGHHMIKQRYVGVSRRALMNFLAKQKPLQLTTNRPNETARKGSELFHKGFLEMDLIEGKKKDIRGLGKAYDWYWLLVVDRLTGYTDVEAMRRKTANFTARALDSILNRMIAVLGTRVRMIASDDGSEFKGRTAALMKRRNIRHMVVPRATKCEKVNQTFQRIFYRLFRLKRGTFAELTQQALVLLNNTRTRLHGKTPLESAALSEAELAPGYNASRTTSSDLKGPGSRTLEIGDPVRYLLKEREKVTFYKAYRGKHWSQKTFDILQKSKDKPYRYYLGSEHGWKRRDELLFAPVDTVTQRRLKA